MVELMVWAELSSLVDEGTPVCLTAAASGIHSVPLTRMTRTKASVRQIFRLIRVH